MSGREYTFEFDPPTANPSHASLKNKSHHTKDSNHRTIGSVTYRLVAGMMPDTTWWVSIQWWIICYTSPKWGEPSASCRNYTGQWPVVIESKVCWLRVFIRLHATQWPIKVIVCGRGEYYLLGAPNTRFEQNHISFIRWNNKTHLKYKVFALYSYI